MKKLLYTKDELIFLLDKTIKGLKTDEMQPEELEEIETILDPINFDKVAFWEEVNKEGFSKSFKRKLLNKYHKVRGELTWQT